MNKLSKFGVCVFLSGFFADDFFTSVVYKSDPEGFNKYMGKFAWAGLSFDILLIAIILFFAAPNKGDIKKEIIQESNND